MKRIFITLGLFLASALAWAQSESDAFRMAQFSYGGTARFLGTGGAMNAIGGDFSTLSTNPAGIGLFKRLDFNTSIGFNTYTSESMTKFTPAYTNLGIIIPIALKQDKAWKFIQFGFGFNRVNDFNETFLTERVSDNSSLMDAYIKKANGNNFNHLNPFDTDLALNLLLDTISGRTNQYWSPFQNQSLEQYNEINRRGSVNEMVFSFGSNYNDKLFIGATIGVPFLRFNSWECYQETDMDDAVSGFQSYNIEDNLKTTGRGVNLKLGIICQPLDFLRVGVAFHTPTYYSLTDNFSRQIQVIYDDGGWESVKANQQKFNYSLTTPYHITANLGFILNKLGFISLEYEFADHSFTKMSAFSNSSMDDKRAFREENSLIRAKYQPQHIAKIGGEIMALKGFYVRAGYAYATNPYRNNINNGAVHTASGGIGFKGQSFYMDFAYNFKYRAQKHWMYDPELFGSPLTVKFNNHLISVTVGFKI